MRVTIMGHAGLFIEAGEERILLDPILHDEPIASGAVEHFKRRELRLDAMPRPTLGVVTHAHLDHYDPPSLRLLDRSLPLVVPDDPELHAGLRALGFTHIVALGPWQTHEARGVRLTATPSHNDIDELGLLVETEDSRRLWHMSDAECTPEDGHAIAARGPVDLVSVKFQPTARVQGQLYRSLGCTFDKEEVVRWLESAAAVSPKLCFPYAAGIAFTERYAANNRCLFPYTFDEIARLMNQRLGAEDRACVIEAGDVVELDGPKPVVRRQASAFVRITGGEEPTWEPVDTASWQPLGHADERAELVERLDDLLPRIFKAWLRPGAESPLFHFVDQQVIWALEVHTKVGERIAYSVDFGARPWKLERRRHPHANFIAHVNGAALLEVLRGNAGAELFHAAGELRVCEKVLFVRDGRVTAPQAQGWDLYDQLVEPLTWYLRHPDRFTDVANAVAARGRGSAGKSETDYDVVIAGGGPAGATLAALLCRETSLRVAVFEQQAFPREHVGESFSSRVVPILEESGALPFVLESDAWIKKYGGFYAWDDADPATTFFEHTAWKRDGVQRWSMHVNRAEFDAILLEHAARSGASVVQSVQVAAARRTEEGSIVELGDGRRVRTRFVVDATGRHTSFAARRRKADLSSYRNVALWHHVVGGRPAQSLPGGWNIFRDGDRSPIGCFACDDGWFWYIPVPRIVDGKRTLTHSLGLVTDPSVLKQPGKDFRRVQTLLHRARAVRLLGELLRDARPTGDVVHTATNYSMISDRLCDYDEGWLTLGDASYFVDPLFSSGVAHALTQAVCAAKILRATTSGTRSEQEIRDLWGEYDQGFRRLAHSYALSIDQWYHAISRANPSSAYWRSRCEHPSTDLRAESFHALVDTALGPDLLHVLSRGSGSVHDLETDGPLFRAAGIVQRGLPEPSASVRLAPGARVRPTRTLDIAQTKGVPAPGAGAAIVADAAAYWTDPVASASRQPRLFAPPRACHAAEDAEGRLSPPFAADALGFDVVQTLQHSTAQYGALWEQATALGRGVLVALWRSGHLVEAM